MHCHGVVQPLKMHHGLPLLFLWEKWGGKGGRASSRSQSGSSAHHWWLIVGVLPTTAAGCCLHQSPALGTAISSFCSLPIPPPWRQFDSNETRKRRWRGRQQTRRRRKRSNSKHENREAKGSTTESTPRRSSGPWTYPASSQIVAGGAQPRDVTG